jgi:hypothetical protein
VQGTVFTATVPTLTERNSGYSNLSRSYRVDLMRTSVGRQFPLGTVFDPATTRSVTVGVVDPVSGFQRQRQVLFAIRSAPAPRRFLAKSSAAA